MKTWSVYLSGEIHSDWRDDIKKEIEDANLPVEISAPVTDHPASDNVGVDILGEENRDFWKDHKGAKINAIRTRTLIENSDIIVVKFGEKYRQWNAAFDAGYAAALGKKLIVLHPEEFTHALKELDAAALAVAENLSQVVEILKYVTMKK
jgi:YtoQ family protein